MSKTIDQVNCTGCGYCALACPSKAINMVMHRGFPVPQVNEAACTNCGVCLEYCTKQKPIAAVEDCACYAAWSNDFNSRKKSASGAFAYEASKYLVGQCNFRFMGVSFDVQDLCPKVYSCDNIEGLEKSRGSKYVTAHPMPGLQALRSFDKPWVVVGTPCQIVACDNYLRRHHAREKAVLIDLLCAGPPTELLLRRYVEERLAETGKAHTDIEQIRFRDKTDFGWSATMKLFFKDGTETIGQHYHDDPFFSIFFSRACQKDACYLCKLDKYNTCADIRISDFWGKRFLGNKDGVSAVIAVTETGKHLVSALKDTMTFHDVTGEEIFLAQLDKPQRRPWQYKQVMHSIEIGVPLKDIQRKYTRLIRFERKVRKKLKIELNKLNILMMKKISEKIRT